MQQLEDALNIGLCGHFLISLATMCFAAFSVVTVQYNKPCSLYEACPESKDSSRVDR
jgi:hypothetical protein